jgi:hypothetical protein
VEASVFDATLCAGDVGVTGGVNSVPPTVPRIVMPPRAADAGALAPAKADTMAIVSKE